FIHLRRRSKYSYIHNGASVPIRYGGPALFIAHSVQDPLLLVSHTLICQVADRRMNLAVCLEESGHMLRIEDADVVHRIQEHVGARRTIPAELTDRGSGDAAVNQHPDTKSVLVSRFTGHREVPAHLPRRVGYAEHADRLLFQDPVPICADAAVTEGVHEK